MQVVLFILLTIMPFQIAMAETAQAVTLTWDWDPGDSGYTAGPNGDVAYNVFMRSDGGTDFAENTPWISGVDNCWWNNDQYSCQTKLDHEFEPGIHYHFMVIAYLANNPTQKSLPSNEAEYYVDSADDDRVDSSVPGSTSGGGGGCFIVSGIEPPHSFMEKILNRIKGIGHVDH